MKDKLVIVGGGEWAHVVISIIKKLDKYEILGYTDFKNNGLILGTEYLGNDDVLNDIIRKHKNCKAVIGVGLIKVSNHRNKIYENLKNIGFELPIIISNNVTIYENVKIGEGTVILGNAIISTGTEIGKCGLIGPGAIVEHDCKVGDFVTFATGSIISGGSYIGDNSVLSVGARIASHKSICKNSFIGVGSIVISDISVEGTYFGIPARKINF